MPSNKDRLHNEGRLSLRSITDMAIGDGSSDIPENALIPAAEGNYIYKRFTMTPVGLIVPDGVTIEELLEIEEVLENLETSVQWNIGDWYNHAKQQNVWGRMYELQPVNEVEYKYQTLADYAWIAGAIDFSIRNRKLSFSHHRLVAPLIPDLQVLWLQYASTRAPKLKLSAMKDDMKCLTGFPLDNQIEWLQALIPLPETRFIHQKELKQPKPSKEVVLAQQKLSKNASFIANTWENAEYLTPDTRETAIKIANQQIEMLRDYLRRLGE